ncbi:MAG: hypothetical protein QM624_06745 [Micropruina sp.]
MTLDEWLTSDRHTRGWGSSDCQVCKVRWPCDVFRTLAATWSDDPEYRPEWAPTGS